MTEKHVIANRLPESFSFINTLMGDVTISPLENRIALARHCESPSLTISFTEMLKAMWQSPI
jgi:hypothetical protein